MGGGQSYLVQGVFVFRDQGMCPLPMGPLPIQTASPSPDSTYTILAKEMGSGEGREREGEKRGPCTAEFLSNITGSGACLSPWA